MGVCETVILDGTNKTKANDNSLRVYNVILLYCYHQYWMASINYIKLLLYFPCCRSTQQHQDQENLGNAKIQTRGSWVMERERYRCAMLPPT
jgi:hypothetical protein